MASVVKKKQPKWINKDCLNNIRLNVVLFPNFPNQIITHLLECPMYLYTYKYNRALKNVTDTIIIYQTTISLTFDKKVQDEV